MLKFNKSTLLLEKITMEKFYVIRKFKRQGCLEEYKKESYLQEKKFTLTFMFIYHLH